MGFFNFEQKAPEKSGIKGYSTHFLHKHQCKVCPLNSIKGNKSPHLEPSGSKKPIVYILGEAPKQDDDRGDGHFLGDEGLVLRGRIPRVWRKDVRFNYIVRTRTPDDRSPAQIEMECCRPSVVADIERTKPVAVFGFGAAVLQWVTGEAGIHNWAGRWLPVKIGNHTCWFFPFLDPHEIYEKRRDWFKYRQPSDFGSDHEFAFLVHLRNAFAMVDDLPKPDIHTYEEAIKNITMITGANGDRDLDRIERYLAQCDDENVVGLDYETTCLRPYEKKAKLLSMAVARKDDVLSFAVRHREARWSSTHLARLDKIIRRFLLRCKAIKAVQNLAFEMEWSAIFYGRETVLTDTWDDTQSQAYILDERPWTNSLDFICLQYFGVRIKDWSPDIDRKNMEATELKRLLLYNGLDARYHRHAHVVQMKRLKKEKLLGVYETHLRRVPAAVLTQIAGVPIDQREVEAFGEEYGGKLQAVEDKLNEFKELATYRKRFGAAFRPSANEDIKKLFNKIIGIEIKKTEEKELKLVKHPLAPLILDWRKLSKLISVYIDVARTGSPHIFPDGMLHPILQTCTTRTWRTSSDSPNIQNWPKRGKNKIVRRQVKPARKLCMVAFDFGSIQARNIAMESQDEALVRSFVDHYDIHNDWMHKITKVYPKWYDGEKKDWNDPEKVRAYRHESKNKFVFPSFFGSRPKSLARDLAIPENVAEGLLEELFADFPDVRAWHERLRRDTLKLGYCTGLSGFRRRPPFSPNEMINAPIQADEAVIVCDAMSRLSRRGEPQYQANLMVHDDLSFFWPRNKVDEYADVVINEMCKKVFPWINVPLLIEMSVGDDWASLEDVGKFETWKNGYREVKGE